MSFWCMPNSSAQLTDTVDSGPSLSVGGRHCRDLPLNPARYGSASLLQSEASREVEEATRLKEKAENERAVLPDLYSLKGRPHLREVRPCQMCTSCSLLHCVHTLTNCSLYYLHVYYEHVKYLLYVPLQVNTKVHVVPKTFVQQWIQFVRYHDETLMRCSVGVM